MSTRPPLTAERPTGQRVHWRHAVLPGVVLALAPKCMLCGLAYAGLGTLLGIAGPELCGNEITSAVHWSDWLMWSGLTLAFIINAQRFLKIQVRDVAHCGSSGIAGAQRRDEG